MNQSNLVCHFCILPAVHVSITLRCRSLHLDVKVHHLDVKNRNLDVRDHHLDVKDRNLDVKDHHLNMNYHHLDVKGHLDMKGNLGLSDYLNDKDNNLDCVIKIWM